MTIFAIFQTLAFLLMSVSRFLGRYRWKVLAIGLLLFALIPIYRIAWRIVFAPESFHSELVGVKGGPLYAAQFLNDVFDERDVFQALTLGFGRLRKKANLPVAQLKQEFESMMLVTGNTFPSPVLTTLIGLQAENHFQLLQFDAIAHLSSAQPAANRPAIFLHGLGGNLTLECWLVASVLREEGYTTLCPSTGIAARWTTEDGRQILDATVDLAKRRFADQPILYVGYANGATALQELAANLRNPTGLILISGSTTEAPIPPQRTLVISGVTDTNFPIQIPRWLKASAPSRISLTELPSDQFALVREHGQAAAAIRAWLK